MAVDMNMAMVRIKRAGKSAVRVVPMPGQCLDGGMHQIEVLEESAWAVVASNLPKAAAENIVSSATNRVICG